MSELIQRIPSHKLEKMTKCKIINEYDFAYNRALQVVRKLQEENVRLSSRLGGKE